MKIVTQQTKSIAVVTAAVMACAALVFDAVTWFKMRRSIQAVGRSMGIITEWERLLSQLKDAETGQRGYLLTLDESYLAPLAEAKRQLPGCFERLSALDRVERTYVNELKEIRQIAQERMDLIVETVVVGKREGVEAAVGMVKTNRGKRMMDTIRGKTAALIDHEQHIIDDRSDIMRKDLSWGYISAIATGVIALLAGALAWFLLRESLVQARRGSRLAIEKRRAEEAGREKSFFLAAMSHEIRTPMNAILGFSELLADEPVTEKQKRYIQSILVGARSLLRLINDILDLSKIEAGMMKVNVEPTDVREIGQFMRQLFNHQATSKNVALRLEVAESLPHSLLLDSVRLRQILINVVGNSLKFTSQGHVLMRFNSEKPSDKSNRLRLRVEVEDTGDGIAADQQPKVFQPFVQGENHQRGTGLGLTIVHRLVELLGGTITLRSEVGVGSTFRFEFPDVEISARIPQSHDANPKVVDFNDLQPSLIVVADDNQNNLDLIQGMFENTHHRLRVASDGAAAVRAVCEERPDIVLMDIRMPEMNGFEALESIRERAEFNLLPIIAVTASSLTSEEREMRRAFDGYVRKPFTRAELYEVIAQFIPRRAAIQAEQLLSSAGGEEPTPETAARWRELVIRLREIERDTWPNVRAGMVMSEVQALAIALREAGSEAQCHPLEVYASQLTAEAEVFALSALESRLAEFPTLIANIEQRATSL